MPDTQTLATALRDAGAAEVSLEETAPKTARTQLLGAARFAGLRVTITRDQERDVMIARVLSPEEAILQARRAAVFRSMNKIREGITILQTESDDDSSYADAIADLTDIIAEIEESVSQ